MKLSSNTIGTLIFLAIAVVIFVLMAKRPAVDGNALNLGMPMQVESKTEPTFVETPAAPEPEIKTEEPVKKEEPTTGTVTPEASDITATVETTMPTEPPKEDAAAPESTEPATTETTQ